MTAPNPSPSWTPKRGDLVRLFGEWAALACNQGKTNGCVQESHGGTIRTAKVRWSDGSTTYELWEKLEPQTPEDA